MYFVLADGEMVPVGLPRELLLPVLQVIFLCFDLLIAILGLFEASPVRRLSARDLYPETVAVIIADGFELVQEEPDRGEEAAALFIGNRVIVIMAGIWQATHQRLV